MSQSKRGVNQGNDTKLTKALTTKIAYLTNLQKSLSKHNDLWIYKLLNISKYYRVIKKRSYEDKDNCPALVVDLLPQLRHYLSHRLIKYLKKNYPFFYYREDHLGHYQVYFGDWWGHKCFGNLDVVNVKFNFNSSEYQKLQHAFNGPNSKANFHKIVKIKKQNDQLNRLIKTQAKRTNSESELKSDLKVSKSQAKLPWNIKRIENEQDLMTKKLKKLNQFDKKANDARGQIQHNQQRILEISKEYTVINFEMQSIKKYFGSLTKFDKNNKRLYYNYLSFLINGGKK